MDIDHQFGADLRFGATGDLLPASGETLTRQRVLKRLLTNPGDYVWHTDYGAGLARFVGQPAPIGQIRAVIRSQIFKEASVARTPEPVIAIVADAAGGMFVDIRFADADSGATQILNFAVGI